MASFKWIAVVAVVFFAAGSARADDTKKAKHWEKKFKHMDSKSDGSVTSDEFVNFKPKHAHKAEAKNRATHRAKKFDKMDTNHDGKLSLDEFVAWKQAHHHGHKNGEGRKHGKHKDTTNGAAPAPAPAPDK
jgi:Ca2+-binding EF-hand superfamily protein